MIHKFKYPMLLAGLALAGCNSGGSGDETPDNTAPLFSSSAVVTASVDTLYSYDVLATDADGDSLSFSATDLPSWLAFDEATGSLSGTPDNADVGEHTIALLVSDGAAETSQTFTVTVAEPVEPENTAPSFSTTAGLTTLVGTLYSYTAAATDADGDEVTLSASELPSWLIFDAATGQLSGTPEETNVGSHSVTLVASDGTDETLQEFAITVSTPISNGDWTLVWSDEFDGTEIDASKWSHEVNCDGGGNNEKQCYTANAENSYIENGFLKIAALPEAGMSLPYSSARLRTVNKGDWKYGRFEIRAKAPTGQGAWPAIWMLPTDWVYGGWPNSGEIDIFESVNLGVPLDGSGNVQTDVYGTLHYGKDWPENSHSGLNYTLPNRANPADDFHTYAIEWEQGEIRWYVDGVHYQTQRRSEVITDNDGNPDGLIHKGWFTEPDGQGLVWTDAPYDQRFHLILNFAVGGGWPEAVNLGGVDASAYHADNRFEIDYVRVYECSVNPNTGEGCATVESGYDELVADGGTLVEGHAPVPTQPITDTVTQVFVDGTEGFTPAQYVQPDTGSVSWELVTDDAEHGTVVEYTSNSPEQVSYLAADAGAVDFSQYAGGTLTFDLKVVQQPTDAAANWLMKVECGYPCQSAEITLGSQAGFPVGAWQSITVNVDDLTGLNLSAVNNALVVFPTWGGSDGAIYRIDNVLWNQAAD